MEKFIGITGLSGTGKDTVGTILVEQAKVRDFMICDYKLSDEIRIELDRRGVESDKAPRQMLIETGNELRIQYGADVLARRIAKKVQETCLTDKKKRSLVIVIGIRTPLEVNFFRNTWGKRFVLLAIEASQKARETRVSLRQQYVGEAELCTEIDQADQAIGINECVSMADWHIKNEGSLKQLEDMVQNFFEYDVLHAFENNGGETATSNYFDEEKLGS